MTGHRHPRHRDRMRRAFAAAPVLIAVGALASACGGGSASGGEGASGGKASAVTIDLTPGGCRPQPAHVPAGEIEVSVTNKDAGAVSEAELRTSDLSHILGEQENLTPGLSGGFALDLQPGHYVVNCPGASRRHWTFVVTGKASGPSPSKTPALAQAVGAYGGYVKENASELVSSTQAFCAKLEAGDMQGAQVAYPKARVFYERIEPVAEIWGALDTEIDGRWENPVTVRSEFVGFHRIEQQLWEKDTIAGTPSLCAELVRHEQQLRKLVGSATYNPLEMASGATDLVDEAATSKVTGEEERYSNTDLVVLQANLDGAQEVVGLLSPYLKSTDPSLLAHIEGRYAAARRLLATFKAAPGYEDTGYVEYSTVSQESRRKLSTVLNAYAEALSQLSTSVGRSS